MYGHDDDDTGELPRVEGNRGWTFDQPLDGGTAVQPHQPYQPPRPAATPDTQAFQVPTSHRGRARYDGYPKADDVPYPVRATLAPWWRRSGTVAIGLSVLAVLVLGTAGFTMLRDDQPSGPPAALPTGPTVIGDTGTPSPTAAASPTPSPTPAPTPSAVRTSHPVPTAAPTTHPPAAEQPPAPVVTTTPDPTCTPTYQGTNATNAQVRDALVQAAGKKYWQGVQLPVAYVGPLVPITVPVNLMKAIAWQESGWQSAIVACDGGVGTMQVMAGTVKQINDRFGTNYNPNTLTGNTELGANYVEWLIMYFGLYYYGQNFDLSTSAPVGQGGEQVQLLDVVVAAYNVGPAELENPDNTLAIPNWQYVNNVEALMTTCVCLNY